MLKVSEIVAISFGLSTTVISLIAIFIAIRIGRHSERSRDVELGLIEPIAHEPIDLNTAHTNISTEQLVANAYVSEIHEYQRAAVEIFSAMSRMLDHHSR